MFESVSRWSGSADVAFSRYLSAIFPNGKLEDGEFSPEKCCP